MKNCSTKVESKFRTFDVICYDDPKVLLPYFSSLLHYAYILHDRDVNLYTGELKEPHYHIVMCFSNPRSISGLLKEFQKYATQNVFIDACNNGVGCSYLYLMHKSKKAIAEGKTPYDIEKIINDDIGFWSRKMTEACEETENSFSNEKFLVDLLSMKEIQMALVYGRDYIKNYDKYSKFKADILHQYCIVDKFDAVAVVSKHLEKLM